MSNGIYAADKALVHRHQLNVLRSGGQPNPVHLHLILSDLCSLNCPGCAYRMPGYSSNQLFKVVDPITLAVNNNPHRMLKAEMVRDTLRDFKAMGGLAVEFTGGGEPTLHPEIDSLLHFAQGLGLDTALITHGLRLERSVSAEAVAKLQWLRISIDAATEETYGKVRPSLGGPHGENLYKALDAVSWAARVIADAKSKCVLGTGFVVQKDNWHEIYQAAELYRDHGAHNIRISGLFSPERDRYFDGFRLEAEILERTAESTLNTPGFRVFARFREKVADVSAPPDYQRCGYQHFTTYLAGDGNLYRCCVTSYNRHGLIGNVEAAGGFQALWESYLKQDKFEMFDARSCQYCQFNDRNRAINAAVDAKELPPAPADVQHPGFV